MRARTAPTVEYFWAEPDATIIEHKLLQLSDELNDFSAPLALAAEYTRHDIQRRFETATDPSDTPWEQWADSYAPYALQHSVGPIHAGRANLHLTGDLYRAATSPGSYKVTRREVFVDTSSWPEYWAWNNFGADRTVGTSGGSAAETRAANVAFRKAHKISRGAKLPGDNPLPERPFVGLSPVARAKIDVMFVRWFEGKIQLATSTRGTPFGRHAQRGAGGRFVRAT